MFGVLPASLGLVLIAEPLVRVVYGEKWLLAAVPLQLLAMFGLFRSLAAFTGLLFEGIGQPKVAFTMAGVRLAVLLPLIVPAALYYGLAGVAILVTAGMAAQWIVGLFYLHKRLDIGFGKILRKLWQPVWTSACMGLAAWGMMLFVDANHVGGLLATMGVAAVVYLIPNLKMLLALKNGRWN
jgi:PST family polysaccharide transporter